MATVAGLRSMPSSAGRAWWTQHPAGAPLRRGAAGPAQPRKDSAGRSIRAWMQGVPKHTRCSTHAAPSTYMAVFTASAVRTGSKSTFVFFAAVFLASSGGHTDTTDGKIYYMVAESVVDNGSLQIYRGAPSIFTHWAVDTEWITVNQWDRQNHDNQACLDGAGAGFGSCDRYVRTACSADQVAAGVDAHGGSCSSYEPVPDSIYTTAAPLLPLAGAPLVALERHAGLQAQLAPMLVNSLALAASASLLFALSRDVFRSPRMGLVLALAFGVCSFAWPYVDTFFPHPLTVLMVTLSMYLSHRSRGGGPLTALLAGTASVAAVFTHSSAVILVPGLAAFALASCRKNKVHVALACAGQAAAVGVQGVLNTVRFGDAASFGYGAQESIAAHAHVDGLAGLIFSPGFGLLANMPLFVLFPIGIYYMWRRYRALSLLSAYLVLASWLYYGTLESPVWHGFGWGPRYLVAVIPAMVLPLGFFLRRFGGVLWGRALFAFLAAAGFAVNLAGTLVWYQLGYNYGFNAMRSMQAPVDVYYFQWIPSFAPAILHLRVMAEDYWGAIGQPPYLAYWPACIPDVFVYCSLGWPVTLLVLAAASAIAFFLIRGLPGPGAPGLRMPRSGGAHGGAKRPL